MPDFPGSGKVRLRPFDQPTELQLDSNLYEYILDLRIEFTRKFVQSLPLELIPTEQENLFKIHITRDRFRRLTNEGVKGFMVEGQLEDSLLTPRERHKSDSSKRKPKKQGALDSPRDPRGSGVFTVIGIDGLAGGKLQANQSITYYLHIDNTTSYDVDGMMNGFRVYSPDGATWVSTVGDTLGTLDSQSDNPFPITID